jgi:hypothetical protein
MSDTIRTAAALQTILADNTSGAITAQDLRDLTVSAHAAFNTGGLAGVLFGDGTNIANDPNATLDGSGNLTVSGQLTATQINTGQAASSIDGGFIVTDGTGNLTTQSLNTGNLVSTGITSLDDGVIITTGSGGIANGVNWALNANGSGSLVNNSIYWDTSGSLSGQFWQISYDGSGFFVTDGVTWDNAGNLNAQSLGSNGTIGCPGNSLNADGSASFSNSGNTFGTTSTASFANGTMVVDNGTLFVNGLRTDDPHVVGQVWANSGVLTISAG